MKRIIFALVLSSATQAHAEGMLAATDLEACGPMPSGQECAYGDDKCAMAVMDRAEKIHACRMHALQILAALPAPLPKAESGAMP